MSVIKNGVQTEMQIAKQESVTQDETDIYSNH